MSRELDAWLAERLFGWTEVDPPRQGDGAGYRGAGVAPGASGASEVPAYSTSGDAMLAVIAAMRVRGWRSTTASFPNGKARALFHREGYGGSVDAPHGSAMAESLPEAVAEAARRALESESRGA